MARSIGVRLSGPRIFGVAPEALASRGGALQVLHIGSYADEGPTIARLDAAITEAGLKVGGRHHEIYLGDPRCSAPEKLRTLIRHPVM